VSLRARYDHRERAPPSLADCACLASALHLKTDLATSDPIMAAVARQLGIEVIAVPDSNGALR
jgi:predicted nucleic acid-binding protein